MNRTGTLLAAIVFCCAALFAQAPTPAPARPAPAQDQVRTAPSEPPAANPADVGTLDAIMHATYDVISGPAGQKRDWNRFRSLFVDGARLIPVIHPRNADRYGTRVLSVEDYVSHAQGAFDKEGFYESEAARRVEQWGNIAQVFSTYESRHASGEAPFQRGINSFQLLYDGHRWWVVTIYWQGETKDVPIPPEFLATPK